VGEDEQASPAGAPNDWGSNDAGVGGLSDGDVGPVSILAESLLGTHHVLTYWLPREPVALLRGRHRA